MNASTPAIAAIALIGCVGCLPDPEPVRWDAFDLDALRDALANPTAPITDQTLVEAADLAAPPRLAYVELSRFVVQTLLSLAGDGGGKWVIPQALDGTSVYAMLACPGEDPDGMAYFEHGYMRLDSPTLTQELIESRSFGGDLQLSFVDCQVGQFNFAGNVPAHLDREQLEVGLGVDDAAYRDLVTGEDGKLGWPTLIAIDRSKQLLTLSSGETLALIWQPFLPTLQLIGANATLVCEVIDGELVCTPP